MSKIAELKRIINALPSYKTLPFSSLELKNTSKDVLRKYIHRLDEEGIVSIIKKGYFQKIEPFRKLLFVYGSLKKNFDNHYLLNKYAKRVGKAITVGKFGMYEDDFGNFPYMVYEPIHRIKGELYQINRKELLDKIDEFEGVPSLYVRKKIKVKTHKGVNIAYAYIRENTNIPKKQKALKIWENNMNAKVEKLENFLESF